MSLQAKVFYEFANFRLDPSEKVLLRGGKPVSLTPKVFDTLKILVENAGHLLEKEELIRRIWQDRFVEESNLTFNIKMLRKALGDDAAKPRFIETVQRRGYRFVAEVKEINEKSAPAENEKLRSPSQKPYFLIAIGIISLISIFGIAFVWFSGERSFTPKQPKLIRLTTSGKVTNATVTPDGKNIVFAQKEETGESLWLRHETGNQTQILPPQDVNFVGLTVSPAGDYAYYSVFSKNTAILTLSRISLGGGSPELLPDIATDVSVSFSPDGKKFAFTESHTSVKETHLKTADADGSNQKVLITTKGENRVFPIFRANPVAWSPDGETIACAVQETNETGTFYKILLVNAESGNEKYLSEKRWNYIENIVWKDVENLAFIVSEPNSPVRQIWQISRKTGEAHRLTDDLNGYEWLSSAGGNLFTLQKKVFSILQVVDYTENTNMLQPKQVFSEFGTIENVAWSKDGRIFYNSWTSGKNEIWQVNADGTAPQQLTVDSNLNFSFAVSPFDNTLVFSTLQNGKISLSAADSNGQNIRRLTDGTPDTSPSFSPDGKIVFFQRGAAQPTLWRVAAEGGKQPEQLTGYFALRPVVSPDGKQIAYHFMDYGGKNPRWKLGLINSENRRLLNKLEFPIPITERKMVWHPNVNLLTMMFNKCENAGILLLSSADGKFQTIENIATQKITSFAWSPDGSRFAFSQNFETNDVVSLGDF